jgi:hypothetical protein
LLQLGANPSGIPAKGMLVVLLTTRLNKSMMVVSHGRR